MNNTIRSSESDDILYRKLKNRLDKQFKIKEYNKKLEKLAREYIFVLANQPLAAERKPE